jgi:2-oxoglutarate dehydrogenase E1 component
MADRAMDFDPTQIDFAEDLYARFLEDPDSIPEEWRSLFLSLPGNGSSRPLSEGPRFPEVADRSNAAQDHRESQDFAALQDQVDQLIRAFRVRGHMAARLDPLGRPRPPQPELEPGFYDLTEDDLDRVFSTRTIQGPQRLTLREIVERMRDTYCRSIGVQFMHVNDLALKTWLQERMEGCANRFDLDQDEQIRILTRLTDAVLFEDFIQRKFLGSKRFSLEGAESLIPLMALAIEQAGNQGIDEVVIGMPHRGRLNVLANIMDKSPRRIFREFQDKDGEAWLGHGDVKYHLGHSREWITQRGRRVHLSLCFNPSHLEFVNPVAAGRCRARQDRVGDTWRARGMTMLIHGDAAFAGEGIVQETLNLSQLEGYSVGGTLHVVVNNQVGFTTDPMDARSTLYATGVARMLEIPVFHVNGEDPEAVAQVVRLAMDFRLAYQRDVVIDMYCYRRRGHNEGDEPAFTQPLMVQAIEQRPSVREGYLEHLLKLGGITREKADEIAATRREAFDRELAAAKADENGTPDAHDTPRGWWAGFSGGPEAETPEVDTAVDRARLLSVLEALGRVPDDFQPHQKLVKWLAQRGEMARGERPIDWAAAEALALGTLAMEGHRIRLSGQDSIRGTFSHRHSGIFDQRDGRVHFPLQHLAKGQAPVEILNSPLSECAVLGFEYGYSLDTPTSLVLWEAQFGDFLNVAQVYVDQFLASAETKWGRLSSLVLLLPHGLEGQGPEHSSARLERLLAVAVDDNIQVVNPTTPAQFFHVLRRQVVRPWRKPLFVLTPKSLLRHPEVVSPLEDLSSGGFRPIIPDALWAGRMVSRVLLCSGKVYYDLIAHRERTGQNDVAILRLEQLYPMPPEVLRDAMKPYPSGTLMVWVQEEPGNMGARKFLRDVFQDVIGTCHPIAWVHRRPSSSPATGSHASHMLEQAALVERAFSAMPPEPGGCR